MLKSTTEYTICNVSEELPLPPTCPLLLPETLAYQPPSPNFLSLPLQKMQSTLCTESLIEISLYKLNYL